MPEGHPKPAPPGPARQGRRRLSRCAPEQGTHGTCRHVNMSQGKTTLHTDRAQRCKPARGDHRHPTLTHTNTHTLTHRHTNTQTHKHTNTQAHRHAHITTYRHKDTQTLRHSDTQTLRHSDTHTDMQTHTWATTACKAAALATGSSTSTPDSATMRSSVRSAGPWLRGSTRAWAVSQPRTWLVNPGHTSLTRLPWSVASLSRAC